MNVLLHTCCGPCASACVPRLKREGHAVTMLFANSNIDTEAEFEKRLEAARTLAAAEGVELVALPYEHGDWCEKVAAGFEDEPEKGARCARCFRYNLAKTAAYARAHGFDAFTTSLTVSPHKVSEMIFAAVAQERDPPTSGGPRSRVAVFLKENFKKQEGFKESLTRSAELGLYRQSYCGCEFSRLAELRRLYAAYVDTFRDPDGTLPEMMRLKLEHTEHVVGFAHRIAVEEGFSPLFRAGALMAALLHDTGRYEQLKRYNTFRDSDSVDHAVFSHDIVVEKGWLGIEGDLREAVLKAVLYHNRRNLPREIEDPLPTSTFSLHLTSVLSHAVRDADKLDIFHVLEDRVRHTDWRKDTRAFWNLTVEAPPSAAVVEAIESGRPVDYQAIRTLADFVLIQIGWMMHELHFATSRRICAASGHLAFRREFLRRLTDDPAVDRICDLAERGLAP